jgi:hypothetical protein
MAATAAWYSGTRGEFIKMDAEIIAQELNAKATSQSWNVEREQYEEWEKSASVLKDGLSESEVERLRILRQVLGTTELSIITDVILEYDFKRRGLRMDCILLAPGVIIVIEFKRSKLSAADHDQVMNYCINLQEFHGVTRHSTEIGGCRIIPMLVQTTGKVSKPRRPTNFCTGPWSPILDGSISCDEKTLSNGLIHALELSESNQETDRTEWIASKFSPSSSILDAAISLYGQHDVSAIREHGESTKHIARCTESIREKIDEALIEKRNQLIFLTGSPGSGKTLVGLDLAFSTPNAVFVTGNGPLNQVLDLAIEKSYTSQSKSRSLVIPSGYKINQIEGVIRNSRFKIVHAKRFLDLHSKSTNSTDGQVIVFDEAQRTYVKGRMVNREKLKKDEAELILETMEDNFPGLGAVVVALIGHNQSINDGEAGIIAWFHAAEMRGWTYSISDDSLSLSGLTTDDDKSWSQHKLRRELQYGHLSNSMRFYRNKGIELWVDAVMNEDSSKALEIAKELEKKDVIIPITRCLNHAKKWIRIRRRGEERAGMIASSHGRRLIAEGIHIPKPEDSKIAHWMLSPTGDVRSSNMLEIAQNQFQIQGLEVDYSLMCWDADLRINSEQEWECRRIHGAGWQQQNEESLRYRKNTYRVLLTRARKGMIVFIPNGDETYEDETRKPEFYQSIVDFLVSCGARIE